ncbi:hypothetical protein AADX40_15535 [Aeromonas veronii]|uniref:hypothetical protein n=1 Tax=Aeromonas TaxID=642 RepID=UPI0031586923
MFDVDPDLKLLMTVRDSQLLDVIVSLDRLSVFPKTKEQLEITKRDMNCLKSFITSRVEPDLLDNAAAMFVEHAGDIKKNFQRGECDV